MTETTQTQQPAKSSSKRWWIIGGIVLFVLIAYSSLSGSYNNLNVQSVATDTEFAQVQTALQRRYDVIPNMAKTVEAEASFERGTLNDVINARARATSITVTPEVLNDPEAFKKFQAAQGELAGALSRLIVASERYPTLRSNDAFKEFRASLEGAENRISVARQRYNEKVGTFNTTRGNFPTVIVASIAGYRAKSFFEAATVAQNAPSVFDKK